MNARRPSRSLKTAEGLVAAGLIAPERRAAAAEVAKRYAIAVTPAAARLIDPLAPDDPIARQYLPDARELVRYPAEEADPIGDRLKSPLSGVVHRYRDRVLIKLVAVCAVYCRFCFRREMIGPGAQSLSAEDFAAALAYVRARPQIWEAVLTGGDPLVLSPRRLAEATQALAAIPHLKVLRWHTRLPVAAPERVTKAMAGALCGGHVKTVFVALHANHPRELTAEARAACRRLIEAGATLVSQSVLLKGVNDDPDTLEALMRAFVEARVKPYYLHHPDLAPGTAHFRVSIARGQALMRELRQRLSGLAMPTYVLDIPGAHGKAPIGPTGVVAAADGTWRVTDPAGETHLYRDILGD
jgi:lysine 2,3-aminomutase